MRVIVCIKQVPDSVDVKINERTNTLNRDHIELMINPFDLYALEEGIRIKEQYGAEIIAITMGPPHARNILKEAVSLGVDQAILISDAVFAGSDTLATASIIAEVIRKIGRFDIILMGKQAIDGDTGQVGPETAEFLGIPHVSNIKKIPVIKEKKIIVEKILENYHITLNLPLPVVLTLVKEINQPRIASLEGRLRAKYYSIATWTNTDLKLDEHKIGLNGSPTKVVNIFTPEDIKQGVLFKGNIKDSVAQLIQSMKKSGIILNNVHTNNS